jgi:D-sedoheptulose 7-phosphate isomerase
MSMVDETLSTIQGMLRESAEAKAATADTLASEIATLAGWMRAAFDGGNKVLLFGNGGSMCDANHIAEELVGRYRKERRALPALSLSEPSLLSCIANDYGYDALFRRQVEAWAQPGDIVIGLSTSGTSPNVVEGLRAARARDARTVLMTGAKGMHASDMADLVLAVPSTNTPRIQECHITIGHILCELIEESM